VGKKVTVPKTETESQKRRGRNRDRSRNGSRNRPCWSAKADGDCDPDTDDRLPEGTEPLHASSGPPAHGRLSPISPLVLRLCRGRENSPVIQTSQVCIPGVSPIESALALPMPIPTLRHRLRSSALGIKVSLDAGQTAGFSVRLPLSESQLFLGQRSALEAACAIIWGLLQVILEGLLF
jgi:hypothetical protein